ncbi:MAG: hypothetical protein GY909_16105 [Oligoflexia bacterium]|nr:hypothetical protein [Oligoflexia bacterium]
MYHLFDSKTPLGESELTKILRDIFTNEFPTLSENSKLESAKMLDLVDCIIRFSGLQNNTIMIDTNGNLNVLKDEFRQCMRSLLEHNEVLSTDERVQKVTQKISELINAKIDPFQDMDKLEDEILAKSYDLVCEKKKAQVKHLISKIKGLKVA